MDDGSHVEFPAEEEDSGAVVFEATKATGVGLDGLDLGVEAFGKGVGDTILEVSEKAAEVVLQALGDLLHFGQAAVHDAAMPLLKKGVAGVSVGLVPELDHLLLAGPGFGGAQVGFEQLLEALLLVVGSLAVQPEETGAFERVVAFGGELRGLIPAGLVHGLVERLGYMEAVVDDVGLRRGLSGAADEGRTQPGGCLPLCDGPGHAPPPNR
jgi:hypothetical protein